MCFKPVRVCGVMVEETKWIDYLRSTLRVPVSDETTLRALFSEDFFLKFPD